MFSSVGARYTVMSKRNRRPACMKLQSSRRDRHRKKSKWIKICIYKYTKCYQVKGQLESSGRASNHSAGALSGRVESGVSVTAWSWTLEIERSERALCRLDSQHHAVEYRRSTSCWFKNCRKPSPSPSLLLKLICCLSALCSSGCQILTHIRIFYWSFFFFFLNAWPSHWTHQRLKNLRVETSMHAHVLSRFSCIQLFAAPWTVNLPGSSVMGFSRQEYWSGLPRPLPGDLPNSGIEPASPVAPTLQADSLSVSHWGSLETSMCTCKNLLKWLRCPSKA